MLILGSVFLKKAPQRFCKWFSVWVQSSKCLCHWCYRQLISVMTSTIIMTSFDKPCDICFSYRQLKNLWPTKRPFIHKLFYLFPQYCLLKCSVMWKYTFAGDPFSWILGLCGIQIWVVWSTYDIRGNTRYFSKWLWIDSYTTEFGTS